ncbi:hypothetical protein [Vannielia litorea]|uniref:Uncharacterized protein n=1 Tax=Vannielia litorea TaxID=1217970 RepID=A0A1N6IHE5_9RHOB|nr:hypothetical protein [Vannielia litorea]SIO31442.1 hypothetical protein SAMN05444002_3899 [Vannielia litorea]
MSPAGKGRHPGGHSCHAHGGADHLTPKPARDVALAKLPREGLMTYLQPDAGHGETSEIAAAALAFLARHAHKTDRE